jgi:hypothetical protein
VTQVRKEFVLAHEIIEKLATQTTKYIPIVSKGKNFNKYEDNFIEIIAGIDTQAMHIELKDSLTGISNPIIYVDDQGKCYRNHGERIYFIVYAERLLEKIETTQVPEDKVIAKVRDLFKKEV